MRGRVSKVRTLDKVVIRFDYEKEIELASPVYLLIKYSGSSKGAAP